MTTLHVCFAADLPQYGNKAQLDAYSNADMHGENGAPTAAAALNELNGVIAGDSLDAVNSTASEATAGTLRTAKNKDTQPVMACNQSRSPTPGSISPTPRYERNMSFFRQLSRRFGLQRGNTNDNTNNDDPVFSGGGIDDDSSDSCCSTTTTTTTEAVQQQTLATTGAGGGGGAASNTSSLCSVNNNNSTNNHNNTNRKDIDRNDIGSSSCSGSEHLSCASSETSSQADMDEALQQQQHQQQQQQHQQQYATTAKERQSLARASFSRLQRRSTSSLRRAFQHFSLSTRSLSCGGQTPPLAAAATATSIDSAAAATTGAHYNCGTPIKSALKYSSNIELNRKYSMGGGGGGSGGSPAAMAAAAFTSSATTSKSSSAKSKTKPPPQRILRQPVAYTYLKGMSGLPTQRVPRSAVCCQYARR